MTRRALLERFEKVENLNCMVLVFCTFVALISIFVMRNQDQLESAYSYDLTSGWIYEDGSAVDLAELKKGETVFTITRRITEDEQQNEALCFYTKNIYFDVYCNGSFVYGYHPSVPGIFGKAYGVYLHHMELPDYEGETELSLEITPIYKDSANFIRDMVFMDGGGFVRQALFSDLLSFIMCLIIFLYGVILFVMGVFGSKLKGRRTEIISIGAFSIVAATFLVTEVRVLQLFTGSATIVHFLDYLSLMFIAYPAVVYVTNVCGNQKSRFVSILGILTVTNFFAQVILTLAGVSDYHQMLHFSHVVIFVGLIMIVSTIVKGIVKKTIDRKIYRFLVVAFGITALTGGYDVIYYIINKNQRADGNTFQFGMFVFILLIGTYEITVILDLTSKGQKAELMEELAYHDVLTGLWNRQAYMREEFRLRTEKEGIYTFIMFDVNSLKQMNDKFGHSFGDELIKGAAEVIERSFGENGMCFRMGGDEFFAIYRAAIDDGSFNDACKMFAHNIEEYNDRKKLPLPLSIAYGYAEFHGDKHRPEEIERQADNNMYEKKLEMKKAAAV